MIIDGRQIDRQTDGQRQLLCVEILGPFYEHYAQVFLIVVS